MVSIDKITEAIIKGTDIIKTVYEDAAQPGVKQVGMALGTSLGLVNTILLPLKLVNEIAKENFEKNINKYRENLKDIPEDKINDIPSQLALPIFDRFTYITDDDISDLFVNLLTTASNKDTINEAHPSFVQLLDRMSPDEAKILNYLINDEVIPYLNVKCYIKGKTGSYNYLYEKYSGLDSFIELIYSNNVNLYLENFVAMGIIEDKKPENLSDLDNYKNILQNIMSMKLDCPKHDNSDFNEGLIIEKYFFQFTNLGANFINSCTIKSENKFKKEIVLPQFKNEYGYNINDEIFHVNLEGGGQTGKIIFLGSSNKICVSFEPDILKILDDYKTIKKNPL